MRIIVAAVFLLILAASADAQPNCKKGIPCGNSCISATKTCRIGTPAGEPATQPAKRPADTPDPEREAFLRRLRGQVDAQVLIDGGPFLGSVDGNIYYVTGCATATKLSFDEIVYFKSEQEAIAKGYRRSRAKGC